MLGLSLCWEYGRLRWWDPASERYLETQGQTADARISEQEARAAAETRAEIAEARVRKLEEELRPPPAALRVRV